MKEQKGKPDTAAAGIKFGCTFTREMAIDVGLVVSTEEK
jgi:hypothetical protein